MPLDFCNSGNAQKTRMTPLSDRQKAGRYVHSFRHITGIGRTDGRTDGIGKTVSRSACIAVDARAIKIEDIY